MSISKGFQDIIRSVPKGRFTSTRRPYNLQDVLRLRGSVQIDYTLSTRSSVKLWDLLNKEEYVPALGAITGNQALQMARAGLKSIYLSGWQVAADNNSAGMMYPDQSLYPANSGPNLCQRLNRTLLRADQIEHLEENVTRDWLLPIVADAEAGFGGPLNCYEIMRAYIEAGAAGVHYEDQLASEKKCGHLGGKVLIPTSSHIRNLTAARLAADVCGVPVVIICRTDAESARLITSDIDERDRPFIDTTVGRTAEGFFHLKEDTGLQHCISRSIAYAPYADLLWMETSKPNLKEAMLFAEAVRRVYPDKLLAYNCSPSFNWSAKLDTQTIRTFQSELGKMGYKYQFVTLAGFHCINYSMFKLAKYYRMFGMEAYSNLQQNELQAEEEGYTAIHHQREVGVQYYDCISQVITLGQSSTVGLVDSTETDQFVLHRTTQARGIHSAQAVGFRNGKLAFTLPPVDDVILTDSAMDFLVELHEKFEPERRKLLARRLERQAALNDGHLPDFLPHTSEIRMGEWTVAKAPNDLQDRRVEITGPLDRKMVINAFNSGAKTFMADFEDSNSPTWQNVIGGQRNLYDAVRGCIEYQDPTTDKKYALSANPAVLMVRPRGWHLDELHASIDGQPMSASLFDFGLFAFHNAAALESKGSGAYYYLPKMESHLEAKLWKQVFDFTKDRLGLKVGTLRSTALVEHMLATFEIEEILHSMREYMVGLNCGRWDYIFSYIKAFRRHPEYLLPDREQVTMTVPFMRAYAKYVIKICHKRGAHAIGGMSAFIPVKSDPELNDRALSQVREDKEREANDGHDGTWVAHPGLVPVAMDIFNKAMPQPNQLGKQLADFAPRAADFIATPAGSRTEEGLRRNVSVTLGYMEAWLRGNGCVPLYNLMEDAATAEISRSQLWQWVRHNGKLSDGRSITWQLVEKVIAEEVEEWKRRGVKSATLSEAADLLKELTVSEEMPEFLTLKAYDKLIKKGL
ncbi:malate synthase [Trichuris trichiura]|uniref:Malate synthase n=1 Tax=Trichuris trichiura TaxID=36087 RepID=A0A077YZB9_TRITR|nr:malate synthase [Trichuris trichiura]